MLIPYWIWNLLCSASGPRHTACVKGRRPSPPSSTWNQIESVLIQRACRGLFLHIFQLFQWLIGLFLLLIFCCLLALFRPQIYTNKAQYPHCPLWALSWNFRHQNLMREIKQFQADIYCLQVMQRQSFFLLLCKDNNVGLRCCWVTKTVVLNISHPSFQLACSAWSILFSNSSAR